MLYLSNNYTLFYRIQGFYNEMISYKLYYKISVTIDFRMKPIAIKLKLS